MTKEESLQLFRYLAKEFAVVHKRFDMVDAKFDKVYTILDGMKVVIDTREVEYAAISTQTTRHERWITKAAKKLGFLYRPYN